MTDKPGRLVVVGTGINIAGQCTLMAKSRIETADHVFTLATPVIAEWLATLNPRVSDLRTHYDYANGKDRLDSYRGMVADLVAAVREGRDVVAAFYGHPGVFACVGHWAIEQLRGEGYEAWMEPGVSAEDCLVADLGLDPGARGCLSYEATHFMLYDCPMDASALLILWQIGIAGDHTRTTRFATPERLAVLVDLLARAYPQSHEVIAYEAPVLTPFETARIDRLPLADLPKAQLTATTTLVIPPATGKTERPGMAETLAALIATEPAWPEATQG